MSKRKLSQSAIPWWKDTKSELYAAPAAPAPAPFINEQGASTNQNPYAPKEQKSQQFANEVFNNDTDEDRATDEKVQARVGQIVEIVQELSLTLFQLIISDSEALKITKEILKDISSRVAHIPIDEVIDKIDDYLSKVDKGEKKSEDVEGATPTTESGIPNQAGGANNAGGPNIEGSPNEAGGANDVAPKMATKTARWDNSPGFMNPNEYEKDNVSEFQAEKFDPKNMEQYNDESDADDLRIMDRIRRVTKNYDGEIIKGKTGVFRLYNFKNHKVYTFEPTDNYDVKLIDTKDF